MGVGVVNLVIFVFTSILFGSGPDLLLLQEFGLSELGPEDLAALSERLVQQRPMLGPLLECCLVADAKLDAMGGGYEKV